MTYKTHIEVKVNDTYIKFPCEVFYDYEPPQSATLTNPSWPEDLLIGAVEVAGVDIREALDKFDVDNLRMSCLEREHGDDHDPREDEDFGLQTKRGGV